MSDPGSETPWVWWIGLGFIFLAARLIYAYFFGEPWVAPDDARFADGNASIYIKRFMNRRFSATPIWTTDTALHTGNQDETVPFASIRSIREAKWYFRTEPVVELVYERENQQETIQLAVQDWRKLKSILEHARPDLPGSQASA